MTDDTTRWLHQQAAEHEEKTGEQSFLYESRPTLTTSRYVFTDTVLFSASRARAHMETIRGGADR